MTKRTRGANGDCYVVAGQVVAMSYGDYEGSLVVHGSVYHPAIGRHGHAWVETPDGDVIDQSNGHDSVMPIPVYYALGRVEDVARYTADEARAEMLRTGHYGPWKGDS
jgi:hypothetical protein